MSEASLSRRPCLFFQKGTCVFGDKCNLAHAEVHPRRIPVCKYFVRGDCQFGDQCLYRHTYRESYDRRSRHNNYLPEQRTQHVFPVPEHTDTPQETVVVPVAAPVSPPEPRVAHPQETTALFEAGVDQGNAMVPEADQKNAVPTGVTTRIPTTPMVVAPGVTTRIRTTPMVGAPPPDN